MLSVSFDIVTCIVLAVKVGIDAIEARRLPAAISSRMEDDGHAFLRAIQLPLIILIKRKRSMYSDSCCKKQLLIKKEDL